MHQLKHSMAALALKKESEKGIGGRCGSEKPKAAPIRIRCVLRVPDGGKEFPNDVSNTMRYPSTLLTEFRCYFTS
jgi:hypothetical protein